MLAPNDPHNWKQAQWVDGDERAKNDDHHATKGEWEPISNTVTVTVTTADIRNMRWLMSRKNIVQ